MKKCPGCHQLKDNFNRNSRKKDKLSTYCRDCEKEARSQNRAYAKAYAKQYNLENKAELNEQGRLYYASNKEKQRNATLIRKYGISSLQFEALFAAQNQACAICQSNEHKGLNWVVDHDHTLGKIRGILCSRCNTAIGLLREDRMIIERTGEYLRLSSIADENKILVEEGLSRPGNQQYGPYDITPEMRRQFEKGLY